MLRIQAVNVNRAISRNERMTHGRMQALSSGLRGSKASIDASGTVIDESLGDLLQRNRAYDGSGFDYSRCRCGAGNLASDALAGFA